MREPEDVTLRERATIDEEGERLADAIAAWLLPGIDPRLRTCTATFLMARKEIRNRLADMKQELAQAVEGDLRAIDRIINTHPTVPMADVLDFCLWGGVKAESILPLLTSASGERSESQSSLSCGVVTGQETENCPAYRKRTLRLLSREKSKGHTVPHSGTCLTQFSVFLVLFSKPASSFFEQSGNREASAPDC